MRDSDTFMAILEEGGVAELKKMILRIGKKYLGSADENTKLMLDGISDLDRLEFLLEKVADVKSWQELLTTN